MFIGEEKATPPSGMVADLVLDPRFAAEYGPADLCSDDGSSPDLILVRCITASGRMAKIAVARDGAGLRVTEDEKQTLWKPPDGTGRCYELHGLETRDLEPLRKTWMLDEPKCVRDPSRASVKVTLKLDALREVKVDVAGGPACFPNAKVTLLGLGQPRSLGVLTDLCGPVWIRRPHDLTGIEVEASDDSTVRRYAYQLGDRVYYVADDGRVHAADLPCGGRAVFDVLAPAQRVMLRGETHWPRAP
jgi:hypothetical protein